MTQKIQLDEPKNETPGTTYQTKDVVTPAPKEQKQFILVPKRIDNLNTRYERKLMTPAMCRYCGADMCAINKLPFYRKLNPDEQIKMRMVLQEHITKLHGPSGQLIFFEEDAPRGCLNEQILTRQNYKRIMEGLSPNEDDEE